MKTVAALLALGMCGLAQAQFVQSPIQPLPQPITWYQQPQAQQRGTEKEPLFVKGEITTKKNTAEAKEEADERKEKQAVDAALVQYTGIAALVAFGALFIAGIQAWFFWHQLKLMRKGVDDAFEVAQSARASSALALKEFNESHFPRLEIRRIQVRCDEKNSGILFVLANVGTATAKNIRANVNISVANSVDTMLLEKECMPPYGSAWLDISEMIKQPGIIGRPELQPRQRAFIFLAEPQKITPETMRLINLGTQFLVFYGFVDHVDSNGIKRDSGFFRSYRPNIGRFEPSADADYEWT